MKDKESIFKYNIENLLHELLINLGYKKVEDYKGFVKYQCAYNYLKFVYEWNQTYSFFCELGFDIEDDYEYPLGLIIQKLQKHDGSYEPKFGEDFDKRIINWVFEIRNQLELYKIQTLKYNASIIIQLRNEMKKSTEEYNNNINS